MTATNNTFSQSLSSIENPVLNREFEYQRFIIERSRNGIFWIGLAMLLVVPALIASVAYSIATVLNIVPLVIFYDIPTSYHAYIGLLLIMMNVSLYAVVTLMTLGLARGSIAREKDGHTWQLLRMTYINNWQIVLGKWWASLKALNGDHGMVIILRVGMVAYYVGFMLQSIHTTLDGSAAPYAMYFLILAPIFIIQAILDAMLSAAVGVIAAIPDEAAGTVVTSSVLMGRFVLAIMLGVWFAQIMNLARTAFTSALLLGIGGTVVTGILLLGALGLAYIMLERH